MSSDVRSYSIGGLTLDSAWPLPELPRAADHAPADWTLTVGGRRTRERPRWFHHWTAADGRRWLSFARITGGYLLRFARAASFEVRVRERRIVCRPTAGAAPETVRHLLLNQVWPLVAASSSRLVLHASAVSGADGAVALVGPGGSGKSTLAAALGLAGWDLLADDALALSREPAGWTAQPSYPGVRLWPDAAAVLAPAAPASPVADSTSKRRLGSVTGLRFASAPAPLRALVLLWPGGPAPAILERVPPREAVVRLLGCAFQLDIEDRAAVGATFEQLAQLVGCCPVWRLAFERDLEKLGGVVECVAALTATRLPH